MVRGSKIIVEEKQLNKIAKEKREKKTLYGERKTTQRLDDAKIIKGWQLTWLQTILKLSRPTIKRHVDCEALKGLASKVLYKSKKEEGWVFDSLKTMARVISSNFAFKEEDKGDYCFGI